MSEPKKEIKNWIEKEGNKLVFCTEVPDLVFRKEYVSKENFKKHYEEIKKQQNEKRNELSHHNKELEKLDLKDDAELAKFIELANKAANYHKWQQTTESRDLALETLKKIDKQISDMENVLPELKRKK